MPPFESTTHSFIIRIWLEEPAEAGRAKWRGHITHVPSGERHYVENLEDAVDFMLPYLTNMGVTLDLHVLLKQWLRHRNRGKALP
jgi:hypothetical protein